jgi:tyrosine decarboxylase/aspartate 1-decarboxylase
VNEKGVPKDQIWQELESRLVKDMTYESGRILGSMCTFPHEFAREVYIHYLEKNLGDPGLFPGTAEIERELIQELGTLFHCPTADGSIVTGGSEANLIAARIARKTKPHIKKPELIVPVSAHASLDKSSDLIGLKLIKVPLEEDFSLSAERVAKFITKNTVGLIGVAGTTSLGLIDPIEELGHIAEQNDLYFHVDAAFGGFVIPFLKDLGYNLPKWDFEVPAVSSMTADPHKMGLNLIPSGGFLLRDRSLLQKIGYDIPYLAGGGFKHFQITGTRPGGVVLAFWALMKHMGREGFRNLVKDSMELTHYLADEVSKIKGIRLVVKPLMNVVGITPENHTTPAEKLDEKLRKKGWALGLFKSYNFLRIVLMPHIQRQHIDAFLTDLKNIL